MNTAFGYLYRDGSNCKKCGEIILPGEITKELEQRFVATLEHEYGLGQFIAAQVNVPETFLWKGDYEPTTEDHEWHEFGEFMLSDREPTDIRSLEEFVAAFEAASTAGWNESLSGLPPYSDLVFCGEAVNCDV